jgi:8-oxo-dGTP pyrophosphatase MutT (NUDIX family)
LKPWREGVRALVQETGDRVLLVRFDFQPFPWAPPGGGVDPGESDEEALRRELAEEVGLDEFEPGRCCGAASTSSTLRCASAGSGSAATSCVSSRLNRRRGSTSRPST